MGNFSKKTALLVIAVLAAGAALVKYVWQKGDFDSDGDGEKSLQQSVSNQAPNVTEKPAETVKRAEVKTNYKNPGGSDDVGFVLGVDSTGIITEAKTEVLAMNPTSRMRQQAFAAALPEVLVGKDIKTLTNIDRVGGSSLTTQAFNTSLVELKSQL